MPRALAHLLVFVLVLIVAPRVAGQDDDPTVRGKKLSEWLKLLHDAPQPKQRQIALLVITEMGGAKNRMVEVALLKELTANSDADVRVKCAQQLVKKFKDSAEKLVEPLAGALKDDKEGKVRAACAEALGKLEAKAFAAIPALTEGLKDAHAGTRAACAETLAAFSSIDAEIARPAIPALAGCLKDADATVRMNAAHALGRIGPAAADAVPALAEVVTGEKEAAVRKEAAKTLAAIGPKAAGAVPALAKALTDTQADVRQQAMVALAKIGPDAARALPDLVKAAFNDKDKSVRCHAIHAIGSLGKAGLAAVPDLIKIVKDEEIPEVKLAAIDELAGFGPDAAAAEDALKIAAKDGRPAIREAAAEALKKIQKSPE